MQSNIFQEKLNNLFSEIIYVDDNPHVEIIRETYKQDGQLKTRANKTTINLDKIHISKDSTNILIPECGNFGIIERIGEVSKIVKVDFFSKNIFQRLFKDKTKNLISQLLEYEYDYLITNDQVYSKIKDQVKTQIFIESKMSDKVVIGTRSKLFLKKEIEVIKDENIIEFYFNNQQFVTLFLT